jgi:hypothetical protein
MSRRYFLAHGVCLLLVLPAALAAQRPAARGSDLHLFHGSGATGAADGDGGWLVRTRTRT